MPDQKLGVMQRAVMLTLMGEGRDLSNTELRDAHRLRLDGRERTQLNALGLVESTREKKNGPFVHELTDKGWRWCRDEMTAGQPAGLRDSLGKALYAVLAGVDRHLDRIERGAAEVFHTPAEPNVADRVRLAYRALAGEPGDYVSLTDLRRELDGVPRQEVDQALLELNRGGQAVLVPDDAQAALSDRDRAAALRVGNQDNHLLAIEPA